MSWEIHFHSRAIEQELLDLPDGFVARFLRYTERMKVRGPDLGMPHTRAMGGGLFELRIKAADGAARAFYCTMSRRRIVFLHHFVKKAQKTPVKELELARRRMKECMDGFGA